MRARPLSALPFLVVLCGCGYPGDVRPPTLSLPVPVHDLAAVQRGSRIIVQFTVPHLSTDQLPLKDPPYLELYIAGSKFHVKSFKPLAYDEETATPFAGQTVKIGVKAQNESGQDAGWSNIVDLKVVPALATPTELAAAATAGGVQLTWKSTGRKFRVFRAGKDEKEFSSLGEADARVFVDATAALGKPYRYLVQAVDPDTTPPAESDLSTETTITPEDKFPPAVPVNITAVVGTQSIELLWDRDTETDLAGYRVYRDGKFLGESKDAPSFSDRMIEKGKRYAYTVTAYDNAGNESDKSEPVEAAVP